MSSPNKLKKFAEVETFGNVLQPKFDEVFHADFKWKGNWRKSFFNNENPIVLELGCGKGDYTVGLARRFPHKNFTGYDIKGARIWRGARTAIEENLNNVCFVRTHIDFITSFYAENEVSEIWITFPDPQKERARKRLTSAGFLNRYAKVLNTNGLIHLKTDSLMLHQYTVDILKYNQQQILIQTDDLYNSNIEVDDYVRNIQTFYETGYLKEGKKITYLVFKLEKNREFIQLP